MKHYRRVMMGLALATMVGCSSSSDDSDETLESVSIDTILGIAQESDEENTTAKADSLDGTSDVDVAGINTTSTLVDTQDIYETKSVGYTLKSSSLPVCYNASEVRLDYSNDSKTYQCEWLCGIYEGDGPIEVTLTFTKNGTWELTDEELSTGSYRCY
jgi:hypothetical protein